MKIGKKHVITHRGLEPKKQNFFSESSYEAFMNQLSRGFAGIEFDPNPAKDGIVVLHDNTLERPTLGKDKREIKDMSLADIQNVSLLNGRIPTFQDVMELIKNSSSTMSSLHLKSRLQTPENLSRIIDALNPYQNMFDKFIVFDVTKDTARRLKNTYPTLRLAPSVAHPYDIKRYNDTVGGTLLSIEEVLKLRKERVIDGIWGDEWDRTGENGTTKIFYTKENFDKLKDAGLFIALVTPELHGTSPGLYGGESHQDAKDRTALFERIKQIIEAAADFVCTDYPEEVAKLTY